MRVFLLGLSLFIAIGGQQFVNPAIASEPIVIAHRGASGYRPEHTISAYKLAIEQGADYIEPDLVMTKDGHFIARHDAYLSSSTDVAVHPEFANRKRTIQGKEDWFVFDFTLDEIKQLKAIQPRKKRGIQFDGIETIPTLAEITDLVKSYKANGVDVGLYIEMKHPAHFATLNEDLTDKLGAELNSILGNDIPVFFQCFDGSFLLEMGAKSDVPLIMLVGGKKDEATGWYKPDVQFELLLGKVAGFGINKALLVNKDGTSSGLLQRLKAEDAEVHVWTVRDDAVPAMFHSVEQELKLLYALGVDGVFTDFPDTALGVRKSMTLMHKGAFND